MFLTRVFVNRHFRGFQFWWLSAIGGQATFAVVIFLAFSGLFPRLGVRGGALGYGVSVYAGIVMWSLFQDSVLQGLNIYDEFRGYVMRFRIPLEVYGVAASAMRGFTFLVGVVLIGLSTWWVFGGFSLRLALLVVLLPFSTALAVGANWLAGASVALVPQLRHVLPQVMLLWFFATPIVYPREAVSGVIATGLALNPMTYVVELFQSLWISSMPISALHLAVVPIWCALVFVAGLLVTRVFARDVVDSL